MVEHRHTSVEIDRWMDGTTSMVEIWMERTPTTASTTAGLVVAPVSRTAPPQSSYIHTTTNDNMTRAVVRRRMWCLAFLGTVVAVRPAMLSSRSSSSYGTTTERTIPFSSSRKSQRKSWTKEQYPNPMIHPVTCRNQMGHGRHCDPDGLLQQRQRQLPFDDDDGEQSSSLSNTVRLETTLQSFSQHSYDISTTATTTLTTNLHSTPPVQIQVYVALVRQMEWSSTRNDDDTRNSTTSSFHAAEEFARHIYHQWITTTARPKRSHHNLDNHSTMAAEAPTTMDPAFTTFTNPPPHVYKMLLFIAQEDQLVYIARPVRDHHHDDEPPLSNSSDAHLNQRIAAILTTRRLEGLLVQHMMNHLQQHEYINAVDEFLSGIDFYMKYGPPKVLFWEHFLWYTTWWNTHDHHNDHEQMHQMISSFVIFMAFVCINWFPFLQLYERYVNRHHLNHDPDYHRRLQPYVPERYRWWFSHCHVKMRPPTPLSVEEYSRAQQLRQQYHTQDSCPICLERFTFQSSSLPPVVHMDPCSIDNDDRHDNKELNDDHSMPYQCGSDHEPITLLRCGHVYDTTCWTKWIQHNYCGDFCDHPHNHNSNNQVPTNLKCLICQQPA